MNPLAGIIGNIETAYIIVKDYRSQARSSGGSSSVLSAAASALSGGAGAAAGAVGGSLPSGPSMPLGASNDKKFMVQFNPSELVIDASTLTIDRSDSRATEEGNRTISGSVLKPKVDLTVQLIFDQVNIYDSFMEEKFTGGLSAQGAKNIAAAIMTAKGKVWSVQKEVEGFIAALRNQYTRNVTFAWSTFSFTGRLKSLDAQYVMFSVSGRPVRAKVLLRITQDMNTSTLASWYKDFDTAFSGDSSNLVTPGQVVGNLFNLGI